MKNVLLIKLNELMEMNDPNSMENPASEQEVYDKLYNLIKFVEDYYTLTEFVEEKEESKKYNLIVASFDKEGRRMDRPISLGIFSSHQKAFIAGTSFLEQMELEYPEVDFAIIEIS